MVAVVIRTTGVLLVKLVILPLRKTIFLLLAAMIMAGTGAVVQIEGVLSRLWWNVLVFHSVRIGMVLLVLGGFTWWATWPGVCGTVRTGDGVLADSKGTGRRGSA